MEVWFLPSPLSLSLSHSERDGAAEATGRGQRQRVRQQTGEPQTTATGRPAPHAEEGPRPSEV